MDGLLAQIKGYFTSSPDFDPVSIRTSVFKFFLVIGCIFEVFYIGEELEAFLRQASIRNAILLSLPFMGFLGILGLYWLVRKNQVTLAGSIYVSMWIVGVAILIDPTQLDQKLIMFALPTVCASFVLTSRYSLAAASGAVLAYIIENLLSPTTTAFNYYFVAAIFALAFASWFVSEHLNTALQNAQKSQKRYLDLLEHTPAINYVISGKPGGPLHYVSPRIHDLLGFTPQEWVSDPEIWPRQIHPEDRTWVLEEWKRSRSGRVPFHAEYRLVTKSGKTVWVSDDATAVQAPDEEIRVQGIFLDITKRRRAEAIQEVLFHISQAANSAQDLGGLFAEIHRALGNLMHAENFFIALFDPNDTISFPYYVDQYDDPPPPQKSQHGLTEYVMRTGKPVFASPEKFEELVRQQEVEEIGSPSVDWLGVPLKIGERTIGVMAVQSYTEGIRFDNEDLDLLTFVSTQAARVIERKRSEEDLRISERIYRTTIDSLDEVIHVSDRDHRIMMLSQSLRKRNEMVGLPFDLVGQTLEDAFPYLEAEYIGLYRQVFQDGQKRSVITDRMLKNHRFIYQADLLPVFEGERVVRCITVLRDITTEKQAENQIKAALLEKEVLLREIHHRVKNNLQVMSSLLSLQADFIQDSHTLDLFRETQARLRSMALIHEELYQSQDLAQIDYAEYIEKLTANLFQAFSANPFISVDLEVSEIYFNIDTAIPCGLIINELVTNAIKYAFPDNRPGILSIRLKFEELPTIGTGYTLEIADNGIGLPASLDIQNTETLGLQLVNILVGQLRGSLSVESGSGTRFTVKFLEKQVERL